MSAFSFRGAWPTQRPDRTIPFWICAILLTGSLAGCDASRWGGWSWSADRPSAGAVTTDKAAPASGASSTSSTPRSQAAPDVAGDDLSRRIREYIDRLDKQAGKAGAPATAAGACPRAGAVRSAAIPDSIWHYERPGAADAKAATPAGAAVIGQADAPANTVASPPPSAVRTPDPPAGANEPVEGLPNPQTPASPTPLAAPTVVALQPIVPPEPLTGPPSPAGLAQAGEMKDVRPAAVSANTSVEGAIAAGESAASKVGALAKAVADAEAVAADRPADFQAQLHLRMLYLAAGRSAQAEAPWTGGTGQQQELLAAWVKAALALAAAEHWRSDDALAAVGRLRAQLAEHAPLHVRNVQLASQVRGFGNVAPFESAALRPGQWVVVYCELDNFVSRLTDDGRYATRLAQRVEVLSSEGKSYLAAEEAQIDDLSANHRRDFFLARRLQLPANLPAGKYVLKVSIEDKQAAKVGESMARFEVR